MPMSQDPAAQDFSAASLNVVAPAMLSSDVGGMAHAGLTAPMGSTAVVPAVRPELLSVGTDGVGTEPFRNPVGHPPSGALPSPEARGPAPSTPFIGVAPPQTPEQALVVTVGGTPEPASASARSAQRGALVARNLPTGSSAGPLAGLPASVARIDTLPAMAQGMGTGAGTTTPAASRRQVAPFAPGAAQQPPAAAAGPVPQRPARPQGTPAFARPGGAPPRTPGVTTTGALNSTQSLMPLPPPPPHPPRARKRAASAAAPASRVPSEAPVSAASAEPAASRPSASSPADSNSLLHRDGLDKMIKEAVSKGVKEGMRTLVMELTSVRRTCDAMSTTLSSLCTTVNAQGVGTERTAVALQHLSGAVHGGFSSVMDVVEPGKADAKQPGQREKSASAAASLAAAADRGDVQAIRQLATINESKLKDIRKKYQSFVKQDMLGADVSAKSFPSTAASQRLRVDAVRNILNVNADEAKEYLDSSRYYFVQKKSGLPVKKRVGTKLTLTLPHIFQAMKRLIVPVFLKRVGSSKKDITSDMCELWKESCAYATSHKGREGVADALRAVYRKERMFSRLVTPTGVGQVSYVRATYGVFAIMCMLLRSYFDDVIGADAKKITVTDATGEDGSVASDDDDVGGDPGDSDASQDGDADRAGDSNRMMYNERWQTELHRLNPYVPRSTDVLHGISLIDGDSIYRAAAGPPEGNTPSDAGS